MSPESDLVFPNRDGGFLRVTTWKRRVFDPAAVRAMLMPPALRVHDLRHTAAALAISSGANVKMVQRQLGHRSATLTLDRYGHLFPDELDGLSDALESLRSADSLRTATDVGDVISLG
jgi:integrase